MENNKANFWGWHLLAWVIMGLGLMAFDGSAGGLPGRAFAQSYQPNPDDRLKPLDHIILTWTGSPATTQAVTWRSQVDFKKSVAEIARAHASPDFVNNASQIVAKTTPLEIKENLVYYHSVNITGLSPNTLYAYRVGNGDIWSEWFQFRTASRQAEPFSFIYFGDAQNSILPLWSRSIRTAILKTPEARFMIHAGDMVDGANDARGWNEWFNAGGWIFATIPSLPAIGNHEYKNRKNKNPTLSKFWRPQFTLPENGLAGLVETSYYLDYQGTRFVVLNSNKKIEQQARWLENVLQPNPNHWTIVIFHHPVYTSNLGRDNKKVRNHWEPLFDRFKVDLVLQGHDHVYSRGRGPGKADGPVYVISVSGPKMYNLARADWMDRAGENLQLFQQISVSKTVLSFKSITVTGKVFDAFDLVKKIGTTTKLINRIPAE
ncbi:MAG: metallophosphoesterase family protein [Desulfobacteraceae bacterium]|jgi:hypothetical protein|nr:metallophosphoesterase family protein [Desulfobacteraceae bacterium]